MSRASPSPGSSSRSFTMAAAPSCGLPSRSRWIAIASRAASMRPSASGRSCISSWRISVASFHDPVRAAEAPELFLVEIDPRDARRDPVLGRRRVEPRQPRQRGGRLLEVAAANVDLAEERQGPHVIRVEHRHALERLERAVLIAALAKDTGLLPEQLLDLGGVVGDLEPAR